jgi:hypothetical protein
MRKSAENTNNNIANGVPFPMLPGSNNNQDEGSYMPNMGGGVYKHPMTAMGTGFGGGGGGG